jgi:hypothetical protein
MVLEQAFSIFLFIQNEYIKEIGYVCYPINNNDDTICNLIQKNVHHDFSISKITIPSSPILWIDYQANCRLGTHLKYFEPIFKQEKAPTRPLVIITPIINGQPKFCITTDHSPLIYTKEIQEIVHNNGGFMPDYLQHYMTDNEFNIPQLINDDYFTAIKLLFNNGLYISCAKLLLSCIESIGFIEFGNEGNVFIKWLNTYAKLSVHGVTAEEIWELRNGLLHMTNLDSNKVVQGKHSRIILYVGQQPESTQKSGDFKLLNLYTFMTNTIPNALSKWIQTYNDSPSKIESFIKRYDLTVSDTRIAKTPIQ